MDPASIPPAVTLFIQVCAIVCLNAGTAAIKTPDKQEKDKSIIYLVCSPFILYFSFKSELGENIFHCQKKCCLLLQINK